MWDVSQFFISLCHWALITLSIHGLEHPWLREGGEASDKPIDSVVLSTLKDEER
ncbi:hypothetical protein F2Q68_00017099 [Brassica cretica]|uniref:Uncharacterized protein n=1 Tax=Brassica cretica TaxID=69181 RepID=A0A8S9HP45_BRACR|nr:hypothetical protein F2Q68_00017099 [Brassica cretica]